MEIAFLEEAKQKFESGKTRLSNVEERVAKYIKENATLSEEGAFLRDEHK